MGSCYSGLRFLGHWGLTAQPPGANRCDRNIRKRAAASLAAPTLFEILRSNHFVKEFTLPIIVGKLEPMTASSTIKDFEFFNNLLEGCQIISRDWKYLFVNEPLLAHARKSWEDLLGRTMMEVYPGIEETAMFCRTEQGDGNARPAPHVK
jgi:hypothetical protein